MGTKRNVNILSAIFVAFLWLCFSQRGPKVGSKFNYFGAKLSEGTLKLTLGTKLNEPKVPSSNIQSMYGD